jgi:inner membrane protein
MKRPLLFKFSAIALLMLLLMIPISMIDGIIGERKASQAAVLDEIARSSSGSQKLVGPILVVPYVQTLGEWKEDPITKARFQTQKQVRGQLYFLPALFEVDGVLKTERRKRGIYEARLYQADSTISGKFAVPAQYGINERDVDSFQFEQPYVAIGVKDIRGIQNSLKLKFNDEFLDMEAGSKLKILGDGVHAKLPGMQSQQKQIIHFSLALVLQGSESLSLVPVGQESKVKLSADWPHPSFIGNFLPHERQVDTTGFAAKWQMSYFSSNIAELFSQCAEDNDCNEFNQRSFGVNLIDPVDHYVKSDRAIKYALMFISLTFAGFFLFEVLKRLAIHPVQYGFVGIALALFYLLLLSLSEHIAFSLAYLVSSSGCILLIGFYLNYVLQSFARSALFSSLLASLYGLLYSLLSAEDYALLMGSLLLFGVLGVFMVLTRKLDWYSIGKTEREEMA